MSKMPMEKFMSRTASELKSYRQTKILKAGAGAGKTTTLVDIFLNFAIDYYQDYGRFPKIVVSTFTRKATQELKERLSKKALERRDEIQGKKELSAEEIKRTKAILGLFEYVSTKSLVHISTIHGVLGQYLVRSGHRIGLTPDFKIVSDQDIKSQTRKILRELVIGNEVWRDLLEEMEFSKLESIVIEHFYFNLCHETPRRADIKLLSRIRSEKWNELSKRANDICGNILGYVDADSKWAEYLVAFLALPWEKGMNSVLEAIDTGIALPKSKPAFKKDKPAFDPDLHEEFEDFRDDLKDMSSDRAWTDLAIERHEKVSLVVDELATEFGKIFLNEKLQHGQISMHDLEALSLFSLTKNPETGESFSKEWDFWMIDEYQDTSPIQVSLLDKLIGDKPVFYVGDPQQSIYLFRGARSKVFQDKIEEVVSSGGIFEQARINYRSNPDVLSMFNSYFTRMSDQLTTMDVPDTKKDMKPSKEALQVWLSQDDEAQTLNVIQRLQELLSTGISPEKICILGRRNKDLEDLAHKAIFFGIPVQLHAGGSFFERREVQDIMNFLKVLLNPHDNAAFLSVVRSPWFFVPDAEIATWCHKFEYSFFSEACKKSPKEATHPIQVLLSYQNEAEKVGVGKTLLKMISQRGLIDYSNRIDASGRREANIWKLISMLNQEERRPGFNFLDFVDEKTGSLDPDRASEDSDATPVIEPKRVNMMTVHTSKGLQFEYVILPWMDSKSKSFNATSFMSDDDTGYWTIKVMDEDKQDYISSGLMNQLVEKRRAQELLEADRVFYVAMTRAIAGVSLFWSATDKLQNTWAGKFPFNLTDGVHEEAGFSYLIRQDEADPASLSASEMFKTQVRDKVKQMDENCIVENSSVTAMIERQMLKASQSSGASHLLPALARAQQGTEAHRIFEGLKYSSVEDLSVDLDDNWKASLDFIVNYNEFPLYKLIKEGHVEWGFALRTELKGFQGQIDLWGIIDDVVHIVDYKTGSQRYSEQAFSQLHFYTWCLDKMNLISNKKIQLSVVYPFDNTVKTESYVNSEEVLKKVEINFGKS